MRIQFKTSKLNKIFNNSQLLIRNYGAEQAHEINKKMTILLATQRLKDVPIRPPTRRHKLKGEYDGCWSIDLKHPFRLIIKPIGDFDDMLDSEEIIVIGVEDTHG